MTRQAANDLGFLAGLDADLRKSLLAQVRNLWTHTSTALEGNTLTLGETAFVLDEGLTVAGKPLKEHQEVVGHARALELVYRLVGASSGITVTDLFALHQAVQVAVVLDTQCPVGAWKTEPNGTYAVADTGRQVFIDFAKPDDVPRLMDVWLTRLNAALAAESQTREQALESYVQLHVAFVRVHPFCDGNGRMARLVANLPVLKAGFPPVVIPRECRREYVQFLSGYDLAVGPARAGQALLPEPERLAGFSGFCREAWQGTWALIDAARDQQRLRTRG